MSVSFHDTQRSVTLDITVRFSIMFQFCQTPPHSEIRRVRGADVSDSVFFVLIENCLSLAPITGGFGAVILAERAKILYYTAGL